jgi:hypothetical protein
MDWHTLEAKNAIGILDVTEQNYYRHTVAESIKNISQEDNINK